VNDPTAIIVRKRKLTAMFLADAFPFAALAADQAQWDDLRELRRGQRIGVVQSDLSNVEGRFEAFSDSTISLRADRDITLPKENVVRVYRRPRVGRGIRAIIGGAIGIIAGIILTETVGGRYRNEGEDVPAGLWIAGEAGVGAAVGALSGGGYTTIYQRSAAPPSKVQDTSKARQK
jgi:hypothetical protein